MSRRPLMVSSSSISFSTSQLTRIRSIEWKPKEHWTRIFIPFSCDTHYFPRYKSLSVNNFTVATISDMTESIRNRFISFRKNESTSPNPTGKTCVRRRNTIRNHFNLRTWLTSLFTGGEAFMRKFWLQFGECASKVNIRGIKLLSKSVNPLTRLI